MDGALKVIKKKESHQFNLQALVEVDKRCAYFYLYGNVGEPNQFIKACWIRNFIEAPLKLDLESIRLGKVPMMEARSCNHPMGSSMFKEDELEIVWIEEGKGAALLYENKLLTVIPSWADYSFPGYSRDCIKQTPFSWPLDVEIAHRFMKQINATRLKH